MNPAEVELLRLLAGRLERLSVDSHWARRASGLRGNLIKVLDEIEAGLDVGPERVSPLIDRAFEVLRRAAQEIPDVEEIIKKYNKAG
jgi:hypothetical protein